MTRNPTTIDPEAPLATAMAVMKKGWIRHLPVIDDGGRLLELTRALLLGSVADRVVRAEPCAVVTRRETYDAKEGMSAAAPAAEPGQ